MDSGQPTQNVLVINCGSSSLKYQLLDMRQENLLASRDFRENKLLLKQARQTQALREAEVEKEALVLAIESKILEREIIVLQSGIDELRGSIDEMSIKAPTAGVVIHSLDRHGNKLAVGDNVWGGRRVIAAEEVDVLFESYALRLRQSACLDVAHEDVVARCINIRSKGGKRIVSHHCEGVCAYGLVVVAFV